MSYYGEIADGDEIYNFEADLPMPYVFYPKLGPFLCFSDAPDGNLYFCECFRPAIRRYMVQKKFFRRPEMASAYFPARLYVPETADAPDTAIADFEFREGLCHQCNRVSPMLKASDAGLSPFAKNHQWYIQKRLAEYGFPLVEGAKGDFSGDMPDGLFELVEQQQLCAEEIAASRADVRRQNSLYKQKAELTKKIQQFVEKEIKKTFDSPPPDKIDAAPPLPKTEYCLGLPMKYVLFPQSEYGAFLAFSETRKCETLYMCACSREAIEHLLAFRRQSGRPLDTLFPKEYMPYIESNNITYGDSLCHRCNAGPVNAEIPFTYFNLKYLEYGIMRFYSLSLFCSMLCPGHIKPLMESYSKVGRNPYGTAAKNLYLQINKLIEGDVQSEFGMARRGERWTNESALYRMVRSLLPDSVIFTHKRFHWMYYLEFDIYVEDLRLAIEYQGVQHFKPQEHWGGQRALEETQERDEIKAGLCQEHGIDLVTFNYDEELTEELVRRKLSKYLEHTDKKDEWEVL